MESLHKSWCIRSHDQFTWRSSIMLSRRSNLNIFEQVIKEKTYNNQSWQQIHLNAEKQNVILVNIAETRFYENYGLSASQHQTETPSYRSSTLSKMFKYSFYFANNCNRRAATATVGVVPWRGEGAGVVTVYIRKVLQGRSDEPPLQPLQLQPEADVIYVLSCKCLRRSVKISGPR